VAALTALSTALVVLGLLGWDAWRRYLVAIDRTSGLKKLEAGIAERLAKIETKQAELTRAVGIRAVQQARNTSA